MRSSLILLTYFLCSLPTGALAFELQPVSRELAPSGSGASQSYEVASTEKEPIAIEVTVVTRSVDLTGQESHRSAEDDFLIYPPQFLLAPGARQTIRVTWLGDPTPKRELPFRLVVEQLPIDRFKPEPSRPGRVRGSFQVLTRYLGSLYIRPQRAEAQLVAESARVERGPSGAQRLAVVVHNRGTARALLKDYRLEVKSRGKGPVTSVAPGPQELKSGVVLPDGKRRMLFPWPGNSDPVDVKVRAGPHG